MDFRIKNIPRLRGRLLRHHLPLLIVSVAVFTASTRFLFHDLPIIRQFSLATGYLGLAYVVISLIIGPTRLLLSKRSAVSEDLRRDVGIWAGIVGLLHVVFGFQAHMGGQILRYFFESLSPLDPHLNPFGAANVLGLLATLILTLLFVLSNDLSLRLLGAKLWKRLQTLNYILGGLIVLHAFLYQSIEERQTLFIVLVILFTALTMFIQFMGIYLYRQQAQHG